MNFITMLLLALAVILEALITTGHWLGVPDTILTILEKCQHLVDVVHMVAEVLARFII